MGTDAVPWANAIGDSGTIALVWDPLASDDDPSSGHPSWICGSRGKRVQPVTRIQLPSAGDDRWRLPRHARLVVYEADAGDELVTVYDCGVAQKPPSAQFIGHLVRVRADHELEPGPTGDAVSMREPAELVAQGEDHYVVVAVDGEDGDVADETVGTSGHE